VLCLLYRHAGDYERIDIEGHRVCIARRCGSRELRHDFERYWTRVRLARSEGLRPSRLSIGSHGRFVEIGATLDEDARRQLARRLRRLLGPGFRSNDSKDGGDRAASGTAADD